MENWMVDRLLPLGLWRDIEKCICSVFKYMLAHESTMKTCLNNGE